MSESVRHFYDDLAADYHHIYADWESGIERQASALDRLIRCNTSANEPHVLDVSCGIGTQAIGLARRGYEVFASDLSPKAVARAASEANRRRLSIRFAAADVRALAFDRRFDVVISCDNSLPHLLTDEDLSLALRSIRGALKDGGLLIASIRDYDRLLAERPTFAGPSRNHASGREVVNFQIWDWSEESDVYSIRLLMMSEASDGWNVKEFRTRYRAMSREVLTLALRSTGFSRIAWHPPGSYFQPIVSAHA